MNAARDALEVQVERVRSAVLARHGYTPTSSAPSGVLTSPLEEVERLAPITAHWGITSQTPYIGGLLVLWRRALRIVLRWYINPIVQQQNAFNDAVVRALSDLYAENERLRRTLREVPDNEPSANDRP